VRLSLEHFSLAELLHDVIQEFEIEAGEKGVRIEVDRPPGSSSVYADIGLMQRVLENLIRNALKYTPQGGKISISLASRADRIAVAVSDTGQGIPADEADRVFDRYYQCEQDPQDDSKSAGLGLAIVRRILDLHGSSITVRAEADKGACFEFDVPTRKIA